MTTLTFRPYSPTNYQDYLRLYQPYWVDEKRVNTDSSYRGELSQSGFLVGDPNATDSELMSDSPFHLCAYAGDTVVGIIRADRLTTSRNNDDGITWQVEGASKQAFLVGQGLELGVIMVDQTMKGQGIAKGLLTRLTSWMRDNGYQYLFSWVVSSPANNPSLSFHHKTGFEHIATFSAKQAFGIANYESRLLVLPTTPPTSPHSSRS
jgi:GNAT superfamily N-acetyltransferase